MATEDTTPSPEQGETKKPRNKKKLILLAAAPLGVLLLGTVLFFTYQMVQKQYTQNQVDLEKFGFDLRGSSQFETSDGVLGEAQLPSTFATENLTPSERVVHSLVRDRQNLIIENSALREQIDALEALLETYEEDRIAAEYFMPENFSQELQRVERMLHTYLRQSADAQRFSNFRLEIMAAAGRMEYQRFIEANQLMLDAVQRTEIVVDYLPAYMFCVGDAIQLAANNFDEEREIRDYFGNPEQHRLPALIQEDLDVVLPPCQRDLREALHSSMANLL